MIERLVENFNLEEKEAKIYLAALILGQSKASEIAKKSGLNRITAYEILKRLSEKGIINIIVIKKTTYFKAISPENFIDKIERQFEMAKQIIPRLISLQNNENIRPKINYFSGSEGIRVAYEDSLNCREKIIYNIVNAKNLLEYVGEDFLKTYIKKRIKNKINVRVLISENETTKKFLKDEKINPIRDYKFFNGNKFNIPNEILIYDNKVSLLSFSSQIGVIIEDQDISESMKSIWKLLWEKI